MHFLKNNTALCLTALMFSSSMFGMDKTPQSPHTLMSLYAPKTARKLEFAEHPAQLDPSTRALRWSTAPAHIPQQSAPSVAIYDPSTRALRWATMPAHIAQQSAPSLPLMAPQRSVLAPTVIVNTSAIDSARAAARYEELRQRRFANADQVAIAMFDNPFFIRILAPLVQSQPARLVRPNNMTNSQYYQLLRNQHRN